MANGKQRPRVATRVGSSSSLGQPKPTALAPGTYAAPKGVAPGWVIRYENGKPVGMERINQATPHSNVGLAPGWTIQVGPDGKPQMVKGDPYQPNQAPAAAPPAQPVAVDPNGKPIAAGPPEMRDSIYGVGASDLVGQVQRQRASVDEQGRQDNQDFQTSLGRLAESRAKTLTSTNQTANRQGLWESGQLGKRRGDVNTGFDQQVGDQTVAKQRRDAARVAALEDIGNITKDDSNPYGYVATGGAQKSLYGLLGDAAGRYSALHANDYAAPQDEPPAPAPAPAAPASPQVLYGEGQQVRKGVKVGVGWQIIQGPNGPKLVRV